VGQVFIAMLERMHKNFQQRKDRRDDAYLARLDCLEKKGRAGWRRRDGLRCRRLTEQYPARPFCRAGPLPIP
jgi:hypothetical protein